MTEFPTDFSHTTSKFQKESSAFATTVSAVTLQNMMKCQHLAHSLKTEHFQEPGDQRVDSCEEGTLSASKNNMCHFHLFSAQPLNLKQHTGCLFIKWHPYSYTVKIQRTHEEREWQSSDSPLFTDFEVIWDTQWECQALCWPRVLNVCVCVE